MSKHWGNWGLVLGAGMLVWAGGGCGSGGYMDRLDKRMAQLRLASPFDEVLYDSVPVADTPVLVRVPKMCKKAWVENAEDKGGDEKSAGPPKTVDPGRVKPMLDDKPADTPGDPPVREYVELPGWTLITYESLETLESSKSQVGCYWYFAVRRKDTIKTGERDLLTTVWVQAPDDKYKDKGRKKQVQLADAQGKPVEWKERLRCGGPMRFYCENEERKAAANPFLLLPGKLELYLRDEGDYQVLFGWRAPAELAKKLEMEAIAEKVGGSVVMSGPGAASKSKSSPPSPPPVLAKPEAPAGEKPGAGGLVLPPPKPDPTDPVAQRELAIARLKRIGEAIQHYVRAAGRFPPAVFAPKGQPHSWRVAILPHLGKAEADLYNQFRLNEPWNSEFNQKLAQQMPEAFKTPGGPRAPDTCCLAVLSPKAVFGPPGQPASLAPNDVRDGLSGTLVAVEANADRAVPWNAPKDFEWNESVPAFGLGTLRGDKFLGLMADGAVRPISTQLDAPSLNALCTAAGGEQVDLARLESGAPAVPAEKPLIDLAKAAFAEGREGDGLNYLMAEAVVTGNEEVLGSFRRSKALQRGALCLRWGIIVETSPAATKPATDPAAPPSKPADGEPKDEDLVRFWHARLVPELRKALQERVGEGRFGRWLKDVPAKEPEAGAAVQRWPGIVVLAETNGTKARDAALAEGLDLAMIVDVAARAGRGDQVQTLAELSFCDLPGGRSMWGYNKKLNSRMVESQKSGGDLIAGTVADAMKAVDETVRLEEFGQITAAQATARAGHLVKQSTEKTDAGKPTADNKLPVLLELRFYAWKKLLTEEQLQEFYGKLLANPDEGKKLAAGSEAERRAIVNKLLPQTPPK